MGDSYLLSRDLVSRETSNIGSVSWETAGSCPEVQSPGRQQAVIQFPQGQLALIQRFSLQGDRKQK